jgi:hypothetical protein
MVVEGGGAEARREDMPVGLDGDEDDWGGRMGCLAKVREVGGL